MTSSDRLDMQFFGRLSKEISSDKEVMDALKEERDLQGIFNVLKSYGYLQDMDFPAYVSKVLGAVDALKYYLDPDTGDFSTDAICTDEDRNLQFSFDLLHDLILHLLGRDTIQARFPLIVETENGKVRGGLKRLHNIVEWFDIAYGDCPGSGLLWAGINVQISACRIHVALHIVNACSLICACFYIRLSGIAICVCGAASTVACCQVYNICNITECFLEQYCSIGRPSVNILLIQYRANRYERASAETTQRIYGSLAA